MSDFRAIFSYEYSGLVKTKMYRMITVLLVVVIGVVMSWPRITAGSGSDEGPEPAAPTVAVYDMTGVRDASFLTAAAPGAIWIDADEAAARAGVESGEYSSALIIRTPLEYTLVYKNAGFDNGYIPQLVDGALKTAHQHDLLLAGGMSEEEAQQVSGVTTSVTIESTANSFEQSFIFSYAMLMMLYMCIMLYGQLVSMSVVTEKSSRMMELLITSTRPTTLIFGKVLGTGLAGLTQFVLVVAAAFGFYALNAQYWTDPMMIGFFNTPPEQIIYGFIFFITGYFLYAFLYAAFSSLVSRVEELNTVTMPVVLLSVAAFMISIQGITDPSSTLMKVASFIPFFTPMAMFMRISTGTVPFIEILISIILLLAAIVFVAWLGARIYRMGVLMYGKPPKLTELRRILKNYKSTYHE